MFFKPWNDVNGAAEPLYVGANTKTLAKQSSLKKML